MKQNDSHTHGIANAGRAPPRRAAADDRRRDHQAERVGPVKADGAWQSKKRTGFTRDGFTIDFDQGVVPAVLGPAETHQDSDTERIEQGAYHAVHAARAGQQGLVVPVGEEPALCDERSLVTGLDGFSGAVVLLQVLGVIVVPKPARPAMLFVGTFPCLSEGLPCGVAVADARPRAF